MSDFYSLPTAVQIAIFTSIVSAAVTIAMGVWTYATQIELEELKGKIAQAASLTNAKQAYEFDARKGLYTRIAPLLFQLSQAAESSYYRVVNLTDSQRQDGLRRLAESSLVREGTLDRRQYYLNSTLYRLFLPLAIYRLLQRSATFFDFTLDAEIYTKYFLLKTAFICFTDHFSIAEADPALQPYDPDNADWKSRRQKDPAHYWRQGLLTGHLERLCDSMILGGSEGQRAMTYGEFERAAASDEAFQQALGPAIDVFLGFRFDQRPVLARVLLAQACVMRLLFIETERPANPEEYLELLSRFIHSPSAREDLCWWGEGTGNWDAVFSYLSKQINWIFPTGSTPDF